MSIEESPEMSDKTIVDILGPGIFYENEAEAEAPIKRVRKLINISLTIDVDLNEDEIWPDGEAPEDWDADDVKKVIIKYGWKDFLYISNYDIDVYVSDASEGKQKNA